MSKDMKILIVDDFATMRKVIRNLLKQGGYENIEEAEDGQMALNELKTKEIDFVISDWNMPKMTGLELLKAVRGDAKLSKTPFLMVTAEALQDNVLEAVKAGVDNYIVKPFKAEELKAKIDDVLSRRA